MWRIRAAKPGHDVWSARHKCPKDLQNISAINSPQLYGALHDAEGGGYAQRLVVELASFGIIVLALRVRRIARATADKQVART